jgi:hypothetical protein
MGVRPTELMKIQNCHPEQRPRSGRSRRTCGCSRGISRAPVEGSPLLGPGNPAILHQPMHFVTDSPNALSLNSAPVAQLDRANASGALGREFESLRAHQLSPFLSIASCSSAPAFNSFVLALCPICAYLRTREVRHAFNTRRVERQDVKLFTIPI